MNYRNLLAMCAVLASLVTPRAMAGPDLQFSGFLSLVGGRVLNGSLHGPMPDNADVHCPCYVADWANFGTYDGFFSFGAESRVGLQGVATLTDRLSLTAQVTARPTQHQAELQWAYASFILSPNWDLQIGRKRIPLYFYSDFQDVGVSYPWVGLPPEIYGWEATNYNGASLRHRTAWGDVYVNTSVFAGNEQVKDSRYWLSYGQRHTDVNWQNLLGADVELSKDGWTVRAMAMKGSTAFADKDDPANDASEDLRAYGLAVNADWNRWFVLTEIATNIRYNKTGPLAGLTLSVPAASVGVGYRSGPWTTFLNYAQYQELSSDTDILPSYDYRHTSLTFKYELTSRSALKTQFDRYWEPGLPYSGDATVWRVSYDRTF